MVRILDSLLGRTPAVPANLDALFGLPAAAITLQAAAGLGLSGQAAVCFKPASGAAFAEAMAEARQTLAVDAAGEQFRLDRDSFGYDWVVLEASDPSELVNRAHVVNATLEVRGFGPQLLCSVFGLVPLELAASLPGRAYLVYLYKQGTFYPFVPVGPGAPLGLGPPVGQGPPVALGAQRRDNEAELRLRAVLEGDLRMEADLARWFPLWELPIR